jgi:hypothetical protein
MFLDATDFEEMEDQPTAYAHRTYLFGLLGFKPFGKQKRTYQTWWHEQFKLILHRDSPRHGEYYAYYLTIGGKGGDGSDNFLLSLVDPSLGQLIARLAQLLLHYASPSKTRLTESVLRKDPIKRPTSCGVAQYIKISRKDGKPMRWDEIYAKFARAFPGKWAVEFFPPRTRLVNEGNFYHLWVLDEPPTGIDVHVTT